MIFCVQCERQLVNPTKYFVADTPLLRLYVCEGCYGAVGLYGHPGWRLPIASDFAEVSE